MSVVLIELTPGGIVMAADTALTERFGKMTRVLHGARKLFRHRAAGIGIWGAADFSLSDRQSLPLQFVIENFISKHRGIDEPTALGQALVETLNQGRRQQAGLIGIEVGGRPHHGDARPVVFRVRNDIPPFTGGPLGEFKLYPRVIPDTFVPETDRLIFVDGDTNVELWVKRLGATVDDVVEATDLDAAGASIRARSARWAAIVRLISAVYTNPEGAHTVGGGVSTLTISYGDAAIELEQDR